MKVSPFMWLLMATFIAAIAVSVLALATRDAGATPQNPGHMVAICHATPPATAKNGYRRITVDVAATGYQHSSHENRHAADIIPPYSYGDFVFTGKNYGPAGQKIWSNRCMIPTPTSTATPTPTSTPTPPPTSTPTPISTTPLGTTPTLTGTEPMSHTSTSVMPSGFPSTGGEGSGGGSCRNWTTGQAGDIVYPCSDGGGPAWRIFLVHLLAVIGVVAIFTWASHILFRW